MVVFCWDQTVKHRTVSTLIKLKMSSSLRIFPYIISDMNNLAKLNPLESRRNN